MNEHNTPSPYEPVAEADLEQFDCAPPQQEGQGQLVHNPEPQPHPQVPAYAGGHYPQQSTQYATNYANPMPGGGYPSALADQRPRAGAW